MDSGQAAFLLPVRTHIGDKEDEVVDRPRKSVDGGKDIDDEENEKNGFESAVFHLWTSFEG